MRVVAALALTLALAPAPTPTASGGPVGDLLDGVGRVVDDLLQGGGKATPGASPTPAPSSSAAPVPSPAGPSAPGRSAPAPSPGGTSAPAPAGDRPAGRPAERGADAPPGRGAASDAPSTVATPPREDDGGMDRWLVYGLVLAGLAVPVLFVPNRRRRPAAAATGPAGPAGPPVPAPVTALDPEPDDEPVVDNVTHLPTELNAIYELGRLDERLSQERNRRS
ncbi:hypothetical protein DER29_3946 [Micromonospora sp. M71_S20]|uniref:hypothetical protein n=1 Tax=Micromonospora sp. M71_S20 TaxID=592872 RepID=UPI000EB087DA|nr:hypothetical protein [Micromonospora sp. M71_S20]RLK25932.1 hypothetical protein DER29_3946 [Micromonospora sp. M71_S20]